MEMIKTGFIGLGGRGSSLLEHIVLPMPGVEVTAVCDAYEDRAEQAAAVAEKLGKKRPAVYTDYRRLIEAEAVDAVVIAAAWEAHIDIAVMAMEAGKRVAMEVGGAYSVEDCWRLVRTSEQTGVPCMLLENCCYGQHELMVLNMVRQGIFGEIVHCAGGYHHELRDEITGGIKNRHYRLRNYQLRNCENYPTHELGPIAKVLDINRGNRMLSLVSVASKAVGLHDYVQRNASADQTLRNKPFAQGDIVTTVIRCARGETITLTLDTTLPRPYSRGFTVHGTKGMYQEDNRSVFLEEQHGEELHFKWKEQWGNAEQFLERYQHPIWERYLQEGIKGGHDGMDYLVFSAFFESVRTQTVPPIDVYDAAAWMCISALSEDSIACGGAPVAIPDFTNGKWLLERTAPSGMYQLD